MRLQEIGFQIRQARLARGLTQAQLSIAAGVSRTTLNQLENGLFPDLGIRKLRAILDQVGLALSIQPAQKNGSPDFIRMACTTASVSFRNPLTEDELIRALLTGKIPSGKRPHFRTLLNEATPALLQGLIEEAGRWTKPGRVEKNIAMIALTSNKLRDSAMARNRMQIWETLFRHALHLIDAANANGAMLDDWTCGGGTVLMRRHHHRFSKDVDIFVPDPQYLGLFSPRLSTQAESLTTHYLEQSGFLKLYFPEGEIDFVASAPLTENPTISEELFDHTVLVETSTEIIAKKLWHRGAEFTARDIFDLAMVVEKEPAALTQIRPILQSRKDVVLDRIAEHHISLRETFAALETLDYQRSFDDCVELVTRVLEEASKSGRTP